MRLRGSWLLCAVLASNCAALKRVTLVAPTIDAPAENRRHAWEQLRLSRADLTSIEFARGPGFAGKQMGTDVDSMTLANGVVVEDPRDLIPVVGKDSATAKAANAWILARHRWDLFGAIVLSGLGGGLSVFVAAPLIAGRLGAGYEVTYPLAMGALISAIVVPIVALIIPAIFVGSPDAHRYAAFAHYQDDLIKHLGL